jgi:murein DD-endopeptidase MepM/ murein hydrolase activator NlpD
VSGARLTSGVGPRWGTRHNGIDLAAPLGTPIQAAASGRVLMAGAASGYGNWIVVLTADDFVNVYGHMRTLHVSVGDRVLAGETIALVGNEGHSTGPHLHFEVHSGGSLSGPVVDPETWLAARGLRT